MNKEPVQHNRMLILLFDVTKAINVRPNPAVFDMSYAVYDISDRWSVIKK